MCACEETWVVQKECADIVSVCMVPWPLDAVASMLLGSLEVVELSGWWRRPCHRTEGGMDAALKVTLSWGLPFGPCSPGKGPSLSPSTVEIQRNKRRDGRGASGARGGAAVQVDTRPPVGLHRQPGLQKLGRKGTLDEDRAMDRRCRRSPFSAMAMP